MTNVDSIYGNTSTIQTALPSAATNTAAKKTGSAAASQVEAAASDSSDSDNGTITSSDFLTLLVTELKNQDPTSDQDPNAYITQLVQVNSLQQLISINQDLTPPTSTATSTSTATATATSGSSFAASSEATQV